MVFPLEIHRLSLTFKSESDFSTKVLHNISFNLPVGSRLLVCGPSGSGKTSLIYSITGLLKPTSGKICWFGENIWDFNEPDRDAWRKIKVGIAFQEFNLIDELNALQNILIPVTFSNWSIPKHILERAESLLDRFDINEHKKPLGKLSRGEQQRVAIARALILDPPIIIADEPTASLDEVNGNKVVDMLAEFTNENKILIIVSHDLSHEKFSTHKLTLDKAGRYQFEIL